MREVIDYCTIFSGPNAGLLARVSYNSLFQTSNVSNVKFHVIIKDISSESIQQIKDILDSKQVEWYHIPTIPTRNGPDANTLIGLPHANDDDVAYTSDFALRMCGVSQWCILAHFDMIYEKDFLSLCRQKLHNRLGMLGQHERFLMLNRAAYAQSSMKFRNMSGFVAVPAWPLPQHGQFQLRHEKDKRVGIDAIRIRGFDTGELLELELASFGWDIDPLLLELREYITHFGGGGSSIGSGRYNESVMAVHRERALNLIAERGL